MTDTLTIAERRSEILQRIKADATISDRPPPSLIAVSKIQPDHRVKEVLDAGHTLFGENRVQEAQTRWAEIFHPYRDQVELHLIGPLQTNKAKDAVALFDVIQTLDREKLARAILRAAEVVGRLPRLFVQVNIGQEEQKSGVLPDEVDPFLETLDKDYGLRPEGLMCIPPVDEPAAPHFWRMEQIAKRCGIDHLSMGMSADYQTAIPFGATHVRVGSALFGAREYS